MPTIAVNFIFMITKFRNTRIAAIVAMTMLAAASIAQTRGIDSDDSFMYIDTDYRYFVIANDTVRLGFLFRTEDPQQRHGPLTERDYIEVANELGVEVAAIKAVVEIETGKQHIGFWDEGKPIINFDLTTFRKMAKKHQIDLD